MMWKPPIRPDELYHWGFKKGSHKYIAKIGEGKDAKYFYTQEELQAYKSGKQTGSTAGSVAAKSISTLNNAKQGVKSFIDHKITGKAYYDADQELKEKVGARFKRSNAEEARNNAKRLEAESKKEGRRVYDGELSDDGRVTKKSAGNYAHEANVLEKQANETAVKWTKKRKDYESKSLAGKMEKQARKAEKKLDNVSDFISKRLSKKKKKKSSNLIVEHH